MAIYALIPTPLWCCDKEPETDLKVSQVFGYETVVDSSSESVLKARIFVRGFVCLLDCTYDELFEKHPNAWVSNNPMAGKWTSVIDKVELSKKEFRFFSDDFIVLFNRTVEIMYPNMREMWRKSKMKLIRPEHSKFGLIPQFPFIHPKNKQLMWYRERITC